MFDSLISTFDRKYLPQSKSFALFSAFAVVFLTWINMPGPPQHTTEKEIYDVMANANTALISLRSRHYPELDEELDIVASRLSDRVQILRAGISSRSPLAQKYRVSGCNPKTLLYHRGSYKGAKDGFPSAEELITWVQPYVGS